MVLGEISNTCNAKFKFLSKHTASQTTIDKVYSLLQIKSLVTSSSFECAISEYVPGKSKISYSESLYSKNPEALVTVLPWPVSSMLF